MIAQPHPRGNHKGGQLQFGRDGMLYMGFGDGGGGDDPDDNAQNLGKLLGKLLRIDPRPGGGYRVPRDNPFVGRAGARDEIFAYGLRNPYRFSFDRRTGDLALADVGQDAVEEVDFLKASRRARRPRGRRQLRLGRLRGPRPKPERQLAELRRARAAGAPAHPRPGLLLDHGWLRDPRPLARQPVRRLRLRRPVRLQAAGGSPALGWGHTEIARSARA